jgi:Acetone carboxylase gamma subunit
MTHPLRENLAVVVLDGAEWIHCSKCEHRFCRADQDWRPFGKIRLLPPSKAGELMSVLSGDYLLRQICCPSCAVLLETDFVEVSSNDARRA